MHKLSIKLSPPQLLILVFIVFVFIGSLLLMLPASTTESISFIDALFTAMSAMTVTGLVVVDTASVYTVFGQVIIMALIQLGGIGIMTFAVLIFMMLGKKIGFQERLLLQQALNQTSVGGIILLVRRIVIFSLLIEGIAALLLSYRWVPEYGWGQGIYLSIFHSISAFNNAGFALWADGLSQYVGDPVINIVISFLFIIGGIGFTVLTDLWYTKEFRKLSLHTKIMLFGTLGINLLAMLVIFSLEYFNPGTLADLTFMEKLWASYFQAVTTRTAGFNSIDIGAMESSSILFMILLMFIGAGSTSTGGGIKLTTFIIIILAVITFIKGKQEIVLFKRSIHQKYVFKSLAITIISVLFVFLSMFILTITEKMDFLQLLFEVVSAFGTVGLSMGITADLTIIGKAVIIFIMLLGKLGPLTLAYSLAKPTAAKIRYPNEDLLTG
ncbi:trk system potassium uptake protein TrkH [Bacillus tianshenii]|uniref:Trk system potassium uptake protein TrkH n=1 Tax=Sutcliffiella tianshenii TaxID=1463404 RepID=A0ABS2P1M5_9BACI|nr:TrkH family potassium uptake protein [Bacillus tianshenii]MBM7620861.1 trk system potassium uptake protein TrkH [Bacillus tianshenii]